MNNSQNILIVENNINEAILTTHMLKENKIDNEIVNLKNENELLEYVFINGNFRHMFNANAKLILMDMELPNSLDVVKKIRENGETKNIPIIIIVSSDRDPNIKKCFDIGVYFYIVKPIDFNSFKRAVEDMKLYWILLNKLKIA